MCQVIYLYNYLFNFHLHGTPNSEITLLAEEQNYVKIMLEEILHQLILQYT